MHAQNSGAFMSAPPFTGEPVKLVAVAILRDYLTKHGPHREAQVGPKFLVSVLALGPFNK